MDEYGQDVTDDQATRVSIARFMNILMEAALIMDTMRTEAMTIMKLPMTTVITMRMATMTTRTTIMNTTSTTTMTTTIPNKHLVGIAIHDGPGTGLESEK